MPSTQSQTPSVEQLFLTTPGLSYIRKAFRVVETTTVMGWEAVGSKGRGFLICFAPTIQDAVEQLATSPYHIGEESKRRIIPRHDDAEGLFVRALVEHKSEDELFTDGGRFISYIKYNWEEQQTLVHDAWTVRGGGRQVYSFGGDTMRDAMGRAWLFGKLGIEIARAEGDILYAKNYIPGLGEPCRDYGQLETKIRKVDLEALITGGELFV